MQFPVQVHINGKEISLHLVFEIAAIFVGVRYYYFLRKHSQDSYSSLQRLYIFAAVCAGALIGSRLIGVLENPSAFVQAQNKFHFIFSNKTIIGGLLGGLLFVEITKKLLGMKKSTGDLMVYPVLLGLIVGRIGCFLEGLSDGTVGRATTLFTGFDFGDGIKRHPLPLYELFFLLVLWISLKISERKSAFADGAKFKILMATYLLFRINIEFLKDNAFTFAGLSTLQWTSLAGIIYYYQVFLFPKKLILQNA